MYDPSYSGALMAVLGLGLLVHNRVAALSAAYTDHMARTKRLVPVVY